MSKQRPKRLRQSSLFPVKTKRAEKAEEQRKIQRFQQSYQRLLPKGKQE